MYISECGTGIRCNVCRFDLDDLIVVERVAAPYSNDKEAVDFSRGDSEMTIVHEVVVALGIAARVLAAIAVGDKPTS